MMGPKMMGPKMSAPNRRKMLGKGNNKKSSGASQISASGVRMSGSAVLWWH
jgi:hypothetical protein